MAIMLEGGCRVSHLHDGTPLVEGTLRVWNQVGGATGAQAISLRVMEFAPGMSPAIRNDDCDQILYLIDSASSDPAGDEVSTARVSGWVSLLIEGQSFEIGPDTGIYIRPNEIF